ncbi:hypothetical protein [Sporolactobacillus terrae]|nr:hypothetical protein [Sporolactobacillus terrae]
MYDLVNQTPKEVIITYIIFMAACAITYPILRLIISALRLGLNKWR